MGVILFVRHGQASADAADHDVLSATGELQAGMLGTEFGRRGVSATRILTGRLNRQQETARRTRHVSKWPASVETDAAWNEFDHENVLAVHRKAGTDISAPGSPAQRLWSDEVIPRWSSGLHDHEYAEPFPAFTNRVDTALRRLATELVPKDTIAVFTSAGVIGWVAAARRGGAEPQRRAQNPRGVNSRDTRGVVGSRGITLVSFNEYSHLSPQLVTYR